MGQLSCPLNIVNSINASDNFAWVYPGNHPTHHPRAEQLAPEYCNGPWNDYATCLLGLHARNAGLNNCLWTWSTEGYYTVTGPRQANLVLIAYASSEGSKFVMTECSKTQIRLTGSTNEAWIRFDIHNNSIIISSTIKNIHFFFGTYFIESTKYDRILISFNWFS